MSFHNLKYNIYLYLSNNYYYNFVHMEIQLVYFLLFLLLFYILLDIYFYRFYLLYNNYTKMYCMNHNIDYLLLKMVQHQGNLIHIFLYQYLYNNDNQLNLLYHKKDYILQYLLFHNLHLCISQYILNQFCNNEVFQLFGIYLCNCTYHHFQFCE